MRQIAGYDQSRNQIHVQVPDGIRDRIRLIIEPVGFQLASQPRARMKIQRNETRMKKKEEMVGKRARGKKGHQGGKRAEK